MPVRDIILALLVVFLWAVNLIAVKLAVHETAPMTALALRFGLTATVFLPFVKWPDKKTMLHLLRVSLFLGFAHQGFLFLGLQNMPAGLSSILLQSQVIFTAVMGVFVFGEKIGWRTGTGIFLGFAGIVSIYGIDYEGVTIHGFWLIILSALSIGIAYIYQKKLPPVYPATFIFAVHGGSFPFIFGTSLFLDAGSWIALPSKDWLILGSVFAFQALIVSVTHVVWQKLLARNPVSLLTPMILLLPVFTVTMGVLFLNEIITARILLGGLLVVSGVGIVIVRRVQKKQPLEPVATEIS